MTQKGSNTKKKKRPRSVRNNKWAVVIAAILAFGMLLSSVAIYLGNLNRGEAGGPDQSWDLEALLEQYSDKAAQLEAYIEEHGPNVVVLENLAENYYYLMMFQQMVGAEEEELVDYQAKLVYVFQNLLELEPDELRYHLELLEAYRSADTDDVVMLEQVARLQELLRENPVPNVGLSLIGFLESIGQDELVQEEAAWLGEYLAEQLLGEPADDHNYTRYLYAVLLAQYQGEMETALEQLDLILGSEPEESALYASVQEYRNHLTAEEESGDTGD
jgi:hypothetical protein